MTSSSGPTAPATALDELWQTIVERRNERPDASYVVTLLDGGPTKAGSKVTEEAAELVEAAHTDDRAHIVAEAADLVFHAWVLLATTDAEPAEVYGELERRFGTSGLAEKAARTATPPTEQAPPRC